MYKLVNVVSVFLVVVTSGAAFLYYNQTASATMPIMMQVFAISAGILGLLFLMKLASRWQSILFALKTKGYTVSSRGFKKIVVYEGVMLFYYAIFSYSMFAFIDIGFWLGLVGLLFFLEGVAHLLVNLYKNPYKIIVNQNNITLITTQLQTIRWSEISKIDSRQNDVHIFNKENTPLMIDIEWLNEKDQMSFIDQITAIAHKKNIYCSIDCTGNYSDFTKLAYRKNFER